MQIRARAWWTDREYGGRGLVHVGRMLRDCSEDVMILCSYVLSLDDMVVQTIFGYMFWHLYFVLNSGYSTLQTVNNNNEVLSIFLRNTHTRTRFSTYRLGFRIWVLHVSRSCESGYYNLVSELRLTDSGKGTHVQRSVTQLGSLVGR